MKPIFTFPPPRRRLNNLSTQNPKNLSKQTEPPQGTRYEQLIPALTLPDPNDRHVQNPDEFILHLIGVNPGEVERSALLQRSIERASTAPPMSREEYLEMLQGQICG
jgi:hypothetical protein